MPEKKYIAEIDGLRALAVIVIIFSYMGLSCPGEFVGVDVFFMISGFLITRIIRKNLNESTFSLVEFWKRRLRRVFPALFVLIMGTLATG